MVRVGDCCTILVQTLTVRGSHAHISSPCAIYFSTLDAALATSLFLSSLLLLPHNSSSSVIPIFNPSFQLLLWWLIIYTTISVVTALATTCYIVEWPDGQVL